MILGGFWSSKLHCSRDSDGRLNALCSFPNSRSRVRRRRHKCSLQQRLIGHFCWDITFTVRPAKMNDSGRPRLAACLVCRRSKIRCDWVPDQPRCKRCLQLGRECIRPDVHVGRQKGIKKQVAIVYHPGLERMC